MSFQRKIHMYVCPKMIDFVLVQKYFLLIEYKNTNIFKFFNKFLSINLLLACRNYWLVWYRRSKPAPGIYRIHIHIYRWWIYTSCLWSSRGTCRFVLFVRRDASGRFILLYFLSIDFDRYKPTNRWHKARYCLFFER